MRAQRGYGLIELLAVIILIPLISVMLWEFVHTAWDWTRETQDACDDSDALGAALALLREDAARATAAAVDGDALVFEPGGIRWRERQGRLLRSGGSGEDSFNARALWIRFEVEGNLVRVTTRTRQGTVEWAYAVGGP
jgi:prepilin-type N-terminal cleavage/methylation domain-containing protein